MESRNRKFAFVVDGEVAFTMAPTPVMPQAELLVAALASDPKIIEIPIDHPDFDVIGGDWVYVDGVFQNRFAFNPNVGPPETV